MKIEDLRQHHRILILGYGIEGRSTHAFLKKYAPDSEIGIADQKDGADYLDKQKDYDLIIRSPGVPLEVVAKKHTTATNIFFANTNCMTIGITGTKGKSTTVTLIHDMLERSGKKSHLVGNIGKPLLEAYMEGIDNNDICVIELSSYQLSDIEYSPHIACYLNLYEEEHNHGSFEKYKEAKAKIVNNLSQDDFFIYNPKFLEIAQLVNKSDAQNIPLEKFDYSSEFLHQESIDTASVVAGLLNIQLDILQESLHNFKPLPHRLTNIGTFEGIRFINDSGATHPHATVHALSKLDNVQTILLGGEDREFDFVDVIDRIQESQVENIVLFPDTDSKIQKLLSERESYSPNVLVTDSMVEAVRFAFNNTGNSMTCLLSPGAPSYTMFSGFPERGSVFVETVEKYAKKDSKEQTKKNSQKETSW